MNLPLFWFALVCFLFTALLTLEGFDYGVGTLLPFLGKNDRERRVMLNAIGPFWLGNEVWLICGGGALFAAFPRWYATLFSGFYPLMFLLLIALIARGAAIEFRSHHAPRSWRSFWDWIIFGGSVLPGFCWGLFIGNLLEGVPLNARMNVPADMLRILNPYALLWGVTLVVMFTLHGALFLSLKTDNILVERARTLARRFWLPALLLVLALLVGSALFASFFWRMLLNPVTAIPGTLTLAALLAAGWFIKRQEFGQAFVMTCLTIIGAAITLGLGFFPNVLVSSLNPAWNLTISNASSAPYTLTLISWFAFPLLPFMVLSQIMNYWLYKKRVGIHDKVGYY